MPYGIMHSERRFELTVELPDGAGAYLPLQVLQVPAQHLLCFAGDLRHGGRDGPPRVHAAFTPDNDWDASPNFVRE